MADASTITYTQSGTGAVNRTLLSRLHELVSATDFGVDITGATDSTSALQAALNSLSTTGGTVTLPPGKVKLGAITIPAYVTLCGAQGSLGENDANFDPTNHGTALLLTKNTTISLGNCSRMTKLGIFNSSVAYPATASTAQSNINTFSASGDAITVIGDDATVEDVLIIGFNRAVVSNAIANRPSNLPPGPSRPTFRRVWFDCWSGIEISACYDIARVEDCHGWPFYVGHIAGNTPAFAQRGGPAYYFHDRVDGGTLRGCFSYAHVNGFLLQPPASDPGGLGGVTVLQCAADNDASLNGTYNSVGFSVGTGFANGVYFDECSSSSNTYGFAFHHTSGRVVAGRLSSGQCGAVGLYLDTTSSGVIAVYEAAASCPTAAVTFVNGVGNWTINQVCAWDTNCANLFQYNNGDFAKIQIGEVTRIATTSALNLPVGFRPLPENVQNNFYTLSPMDAGGLVYNNGGGNYTYSIPANSSVPFPIGTQITLVCDDPGSGGTTISPNSGVTLVQAGTGAVGGRGLGDNAGLARLLKVGTDRWLIEGPGVS